MLLDLPVEVPWRRRQGQAPDRIEGGGTGDLHSQSEFHLRVRRGYLALAQEEPDRWLVVDAALPRNAVSETVWARVRTLLEGCDP